MKDATEIVIILDRSGSMNAVKSDAIGGFNQFLKEQKAEKGEANLTLIQFSTYVDTQIYGKPLAEVPELTEDTYTPGGFTALNDAVAHSIIETGKRLEKLSEDERPDKVIVVIITDGEENASREHSKEAVANMVKHQEDKYNWQFLYLGSSVNAFAEAKNVGLRQDNVMNFAPGSDGMKSAYMSANNAVRLYRWSGKLSKDWKDQPKK